MFAIIRESKCVAARLSAFSAVVFTLLGGYGSTALAAQGYAISNLVADLPGVAAHTDTNLVNAWGMALLPKDMLLVNANENNLTGLYGMDGTPSGAYLAVDSAPSGLVWNRTGGFKVAEGRLTRPSTLIFVTENGTILGWNEDFTNDTAIVEADNSIFDAVYKGVAVSGNRLFAADFKGGIIDVYDGKWNWLGAFTDSRVDAGFGPFNVAVINGLLYVTFAKKLPPDFEDDEAGPGNGFVDVFDLNGRFVRRLVSHGVLNSPWGIAKAPANFGKFSGALLIGNFGDGTVNAFDIKTGALLGTLSDSANAPLVIDGLWALEFGTAKVKGKNEPALFFSAGPNGESDGVVGRITAN